MRLGHALYSSLQTGPDALYATAIDAKKFLIKSHKDLSNEMNGEKTEKKNGELRVI